MTHRITQSQVFANAARRHLYDSICNQPGIPFLALVENSRSRFGHAMGFGAVQYHLQVLQRMGYISAYKSGRHRRYYQNGGPWNGQAGHLALVQVSSMARLAHLLVRRPGASQKELWQGLHEERPCTRQGVGYLLRRLAELDLVHVSRQGRSKRYRASPALARLLAYVAPPRAASVETVRPTPIGSLTLLEAPPEVPA